MLKTTRSPDLSARPLPIGSCHARPVEPRMIDRHVFKDALCKSSVRLYRGPRRQDRCPRRTQNAHYRESFQAMSNGCFIGSSKEGHYDRHLKRLAQRIEAAAVQVMQKFSRNGHSIFAGNGADTIYLLPCRSILTILNSPALAPRKASLSRREVSLYQQTEPRSSRI